MLPIRRFGQHPDCFFVLLGNGQLELTLPATAFTTRLGGIRLDEGARGVYLLHI